MYRRLIDEKLRFEEKTHGQGMASWHCLARRSQSDSYDHIISGHIRRDHRESCEGFREKKVFSEIITEDSSEKAEGKID